jgi:ABC-type multidrug transport system permease subunit
VGLFLTLGLAALGGCWWPLEVVPEGMRAVALALPTGQAMHALVRLLVWGDPPAALGGVVVYFLAFAAVSATAAALVLRRRVA